MHGWIIEWSQILMQKLYKILTVKILLQSILLLPPSPLLSFMKSDKRTDSKNNRKVLSYRKLSDLETGSEVVA